MLAIGALRAPGKRVTGSKLLSETLLRNKTRGSAVRSSPKTYTALAENLSSVPSTHMANLHLPVTLVPWDLLPSPCFHGLPCGTHKFTQAYTHTHTHTHTHTCK